MNEHRRKAAVSSLLQEMSGKGLKNVELAELTGWSTSKISKMLSGKQAFTDEDLRVWARALGYMYLGKGLMEGANVLCLCPNCAAKLRNGTYEDREEMLIGLYRSHKKLLENAGVTITLGQLLKTHKL